MSWREEERRENWEKEGKKKKENFARANRVPLQQGRKETRGWRGAGLGGRDKGAGGERHTPLSTFHILVQPSSIRFVTERHLLYEV